MSAPATIVRLFKSIRASALRRLIQISQLLRATQVKPPMLPILEVFLDSFVLFSFLPSADLTVICDRLSCLVLYHPFHCA